MSKPLINVLALLMIGVATSQVFSMQTVARAQETPGARDAEMETVKARLVAMLLPADDKARQALADTVATLLKTQGEDGKWANLTYADTGPTDWGASQHMERVLQMTRLYATPGQPLYHDANLLQHINRGWDVWFAGNYVNSNWWWNDIGVPQKVGAMLLLLEDVISPERKAAGLANLKRSGDDRSMYTATGANLSWLARIQLMRGLAMPSPKLVADSFNVVWREIEVHPQDADGIQADFSFHQHGPIPYNGGYGTAFTSYVVDFQNYARGTRFALPPDKEHLFVDFVIDGQDWMSRGNQFDMAAQGRALTRKPNNEALKPGDLGWRKVAETLANTTDYRHDDLLAVAHRLAPGGTVRVGNRQFWNSDFMTHHRLGYYVSVRTHSTRTRNTDGSSKDGAPINGDGRFSHHVADGAMTLWRRGDEYTGIYPLWNWNRIPGTTAQQVASLDEKHVAFKGASDFVGGVSDGLYGATTMTLERDGLSAKKSWFFFDKEFVALGAGITDASGQPVITSVNQSLLHGDVRVSGEATPLAVGEHEKEGTRWVLHDETGYLFPPNSSFHVENQPRTGHWGQIGSTPGPDTPVTKGVFDLYLDHGTKPTGASYEYTVIPDASVQDLNARLVRSPIATLSNTPDLQAVLHNDLHILQAVFRRAGGVQGGAGWNLSVDAPCLVMVREVTGGVEIAVANPENKPLAVNLELDRPLTGEGVIARDNTTKIRFDLPGGPEAGSSVVRVLKQN